MRSFHGDLCFLLNYFKIVTSLFLHDVSYMSDSLPWSSSALLSVGWQAGLLCTFGSCPTRFLFGGHQKHFTLIARRALIQCNLFVCLFASLPELLVIYSLFLEGGNSSMIWTHWTGNRVRALCWVRYGDILGWLSLTAVKEHINQHFYVAEIKFNNIITINKPLFIQSSQLRTNYSTFQWWPALI